MADKICNKFFYCLEYCPMEFSTDRPIYMQVAEITCEKIMLRQYRPDTRIPSVREMAALQQVNPNTVLRAYDLLQGLAIITNKRGIGYYVSPDGLRRATSFRRDGFLQKEIPRFFRSASLLHISPEKLKEQYLAYRKSAK